MTDLDEDRFVTPSTQDRFRQWGDCGNPALRPLTQGSPYLHVEAPAICQFCQTVHPQTGTLKVCSFCHRKQEETPSCGTPSQS